MRRILPFLVALLLAWVLVRRGSTSVDTRTTVPTHSPPAATTASPDAPVVSVAPSRSSRAESGKGFRNRDRLDEHFAKHGGEFGGISKGQYLALAQSLRDEQVGGDILEVIRPNDGVVSRFDKRSGAFLAFDRDGTIRTFFKPNDGERYFRRQANRPPSP